MCLVILDYTSSYHLGFTSVEEVLSQQPIRTRPSTSHIEMFDTEEYERWLAHAKYTLESAKDDMKAGKFSWSCFKCQQAAESALKALLYGLGSLPTGHSLTRLLGTLGERGFKVEGLLSHARRLDRHYVATRYPNAHAVGAPFEYYDYETASEALNSAEALVKMVEEAAAECT